MRASQRAIAAIAVLSVACSGDRGWIQFRGDAASSRARNSFLGPNATTIAYPGSQATSSSAVSSVTVALVRISANSSWEVPVAAFLPTLGMLAAVPLVQGGNGTALTLAGQTSWSGSSCPVFTWPSPVTVASGNGSAIVLVTAVNGTQGVVVRARINMASPASVQSFTQADVTIIGNATNATCLAPAVAMSAGNSSFSSLVAVVDDSIVCLITGTAGGIGNVSQPLQERWRVNMTLANDTQPVSVLPLARSPRDDALVYVASLHASATAWNDTASPQGAHNATVNLVSVAALNASTGDVAWRYCCVQVADTVPGLSWLPAVAGSDNGTDVIVVAGRTWDGMGGSNVTVLGISNGTLSWQLATNTSGVVVGAPAIANGTVAVVAVAGNNSQLGASPLWPALSNASTLLFVNTSSGAVLSSWSLPGNNSVATVPVVDAVGTAAVALSDGTVVLVSMAGETARTAVFGQGNNTGNASDWRMAGVRAHAPAVLPDGSVALTGADGSLSVVGNPLPTWSPAATPSPSPTPTSSPSSAPSATASSTATPSSPSTPTGTPSPLPPVVPLAGVSPSDPAVVAPIAVAGVLAGGTVVVAAATAALIWRVPRLAGAAMKLWAWVRVGGTVAMAAARVATLVSASAASGQVSPWPCYVTTHPSSGVQVNNGGVTSVGTGDLTVLQVCSQQPTTVLTSIPQLARWLYLPSTLDYVPISLSQLQASVPAFAASLRMETVMAWPWTVMAVLVWLAALEAPVPFYRWLTLADQSATVGRVIARIIAVPFIMAAVTCVFVGFVHPHALSITCIPTPSGPCDVVVGAASVAYGRAWTGFLITTVVWLLAAAALIGAALACLCFCVRGNWRHQVIQNGVVVQEWVEDNTESDEAARQCAGVLVQPVPACVGIAMLCLLLWIVVSPIVGMAGSVEIAATTATEPQWPLQPLGPTPIGFTSTLPTGRPSLTSLHVCGMLTFYAGIIAVVAAAAVPVWRVLALSVMKARAVSSEADTVNDMLPSDEELPSLAPLLACLHHRSRAAAEPGGGGTGAPTSPQVTAVVGPAATVVINPMATANNAADTSGGVTVLHIDHGTGQVNVVYGVGAAAP